ncbi:hypothetical protein CRM90_00980 [Mycobacterium sp. ENV421]|uniref:hypothetical protein n=1 Tax=Mycobacterium sp. ENV421 TaxID=1213407 RepID=UPI000C9A4C29|nr:hypothetical protein [Mycobacterium sp. ENV421]PND59585.1 hypothetical protein CRM90_00980 [Mycobacterium sp. ENV421]
MTATEQLAYRTIAACWTIEHRADGVKFGRALFGGRSAQPHVEALTALATAVRTGAAAPEHGDPLPFLADEVTELRRSLAHN